MKNFIFFKLDKVEVAIICCLIVGCIFLLFFFEQQHTAKESIDMTDYYNSVIVGRQFDYNSKQVGAELVTFRRGDKVWTESFIEAVFQLYEIGDTIK